MSFLVTFLEGVVTFISPCLLPLLPVYVAYFAGDAGNADAPNRLQRTVLNACGFVLGFSILFTAMGAFAGSVGAFFRDNQTVLNVVCGVIVIVLGLNYLGVLRIPALQRMLKPQVEVVPRSFATSLVFGIVFAVGWTPCVGAFLGAAVSLAATSGDAVIGVGLLLSYSLGLGIPFVVAAVLIDQLSGAFTWIKAHYRVVDAVCGALLVVVGVLMATGTLGVWLRMLSA